MRLIDADKLGLTDFEILMCNGDCKEALKMLLDKIEKAPTEYDIESVIKKLESLDESYHKNKFVEYEQILHFAIELVKAGGENE